MDLKAEFDRALRKVQDTYGDRDERWIPGVAFCKKAFTGTKEDPNVWNVMAFILNRNEDFVRFDLLHECTHVLNPTRNFSRDISYLEEGAATLISLSATDYNDPNFVSCQRKGLAKASPGTREARYHEALTDLEALTKQPLELIKALREPNGRSLSSDEVADDIVRRYPGNEVRAKRLCRKFYIDPSPISMCG